MNKALTAPLLSDLWRCFEDHWVLGFQADHHPCSPSAQKKKKASKARSMRTRAFEGKCLFCLSCRCHLSRGSEGTEWIPYFREEVKWGVCDALTSRRFLNKSLTMIKQLKGAARTWNNGFYVTQKNIPVHLVFSEIKHLEKCLLHEEMKVAPFSSVIPSPLGSRGIHSPSNNDGGYQTEVTEADSYREPAFNRRFRSPDRWIKNLLTTEDRSRAKVNVRCCGVWRGHTGSKQM